MPQMLRQATAHQPPPSQANARKLRAVLPDWDYTCRRNSHQSKTALTNFSMTFRLDGQQWKSWDWVWILTPAPTSSGTKITEAEMRHTVEHDRLIWVLLKSNLSRHWQINCPGSSLHVIQELEAGLMSAALTYITKAFRIAAMRLSNKSQPRENSQGLGIALYSSTSIFDIPRDDWYVLAMCE